MPLIEIIDAGRQGRPPTSERRSRRESWDPGRRRTASSAVASNATAKGKFFIPGSGRAIALSGKCYGVRQHCHVARSGDPASQLNHMEQRVFFRRIHQHQIRGMRAAIAQKASDSVTAASFQRPVSCSAPSARSSRDADGIVTQSPGTVARIEIDHAHATGAPFRGLPPKKRSATSKYMAFLPAAARSRARSGRTAGPSAPTRQYPWLVPLDRTGRGSAGNRRPRYSSRRRSSAWRCGSA